ncbi:MAG: HD domain-containing phosphohydrolase [Planctomycetota bacterium]
MSKVMLVDDELNVLNGFRRTLGTKYDCVLAQGAAEALSELCQTTDIAVIVTDMRMPGMDGITFINQARQVAPDALYLMLTGNADLETAAEAVNQGRVFRFLNKPCPPEVLQPAIDAALHQHALVLAEQELLRKTLTGSVRLLTEMHGLAKPGLAEHTGRVRRTVRQLVHQIKLPDPWVHEVAAMLSQIGRFTLPHEIANADPKTLEDQNDIDLLHSHPARAAQLLRHIPRLELPGRIIEQQLDAQEPSGSPVEAAGNDLVYWGASVLRVALAFDAVYSKNPSEIDARVTVSESLAEACPVVTKALMDMATTECENSAAPLRVVNAEQLREGMFTAAPVLLCDGRPLLGRGRELSEPLIAQLRAHIDRGLLSEPLDMLVPDDVDQEEQLPDGGFEQAA